MKNNFYFFIGLFSALLISWLGIVIGSNAQLGSLPPYYDDNDGATHPEWMSGVAAQGQLVYRDLGCIACHTQQVRRPSFGSDQARGWGDRQSVARDYIYQPFPQLGLQRVGPDLTNLEDRKPTAPDADDLMNLLYAGSHGMPSYKFLFETRKLGSEAQPSEKALKLTGPLKPKDGWEIVPTSRAESLVGYLVSLKTTYSYPEATPFTPGKPEGEEPKPVAKTAAAAAPGPASPVPPFAPAATMQAPAAATPATAAPAAAASAAASAGGSPPSQAPSGTPAPSVAPGATTPAPSAALAAPAAPAPASGAPAAPAPATPAGTASPTPSVAPAAPASAPPAANAAATPSAPAAPAPSTTPPTGGQPPTPSPTGTATPTGTGGTK